MRRFNLSDGWLLICESIDGGGAAVDATNKIWYIKNWNQIFFSENQIFAEFSGKKTSRFLSEIVSLQIVVVLYHIRREG